MESGTLEILSRPFERSEIKQRPGYNGKTLDYVEAHTVIARLNEAFDGDWTFQVVKHDVSETDVIVLGRLVAGGEIKEQFGGKPRTSGSQLGDDLKAAGSDCLKKCATLLGVALHLYRDEVVPGDNGDNGKTEDRDNLTPAQKVLRERKAQLATK